MWGAFRSSLSHVNFHCSLSVDGKALVWLDSNAEQPRVGIDQLIFVPHHRVPKDTSIIEICQACHVFSTVKFWRIDLPDLVFFEDLFLLVYEMEKECFNIVISCLTIRYNSKHTECRLFVEIVQYHDQIC